MSVAVEICKNYLKIAVAQAGIPPAALTALYVEPISGFTDDQIAGRLSDIVRREKIKAKAAFLCLSRDIVTVRNLHLPSQDSREITQMIQLHISRIVPYKPDEILFDYKVTGSDNVGYACLTLAIVQIEAVRRYVSLIERTGFFIDGISLSSGALFTWILRRLRAEMTAVNIYALLDIDAHFTDFIVFSQQGLLFTRTIPIGALLLAAGGDPASMTKLLGEVKQSLLIFNNEELNKKPEKVFISGAGMVEKTIPLIEKEMSIPVRYLSPSHSEKASLIKQINIPSDVSLTAVTELSGGPSSQSISFSLPEIQIKKTLKEQTRHLVTAGGLLLYLVVAVCGLSLGQVFNQQAYIARLQQRLIEVDKDTGGLVSQVKKIAVVRKVLSERNLPLLVMTQLQQVTPADVMVTYTGIDEADIVTVRGQTSQVSGIFKFIGALEKVRAFKDIQNKSTRTRKVKDLELTDFEIVFKAGYNT